MYKAIDFPSPLLLFLALFRSLSLSCSLLLSLSLSGGGGGFGPLSRSGFECSPSAFIGWEDRLLGLRPGAPSPERGEGCGGDRVCNIWMTVCTNSLVVAVSTV